MPLPLPQLTQERRHQLRTFRPLPSASAADVTSPFATLPPESTADPLRLSLPPCPSKSALSLETGHRVCSKVQRKAAPPASTEAGAPPASDGMDPIPLRDLLASSSPDARPDDPAAGPKTGPARPSFQCAPAFRVTREAQRSGVSGLLVAKCVLDLDGRLCDCKVEKSLPGQDETFLDALDTLQYSPILYQGRSQRVSLTVHFTIRPSLGPKPAP
jgi:TonB family protein